MFRPLDGHILAIKINKNKIKIQFLHFSFSLKYNCISVTFYVLILVDGSELQAGKSGLRFPMGLIRIFH